MSDGLNVFDFKPGQLGLFELNDTEEIPLGGLLSCFNIWPKDGALTPTPVAQPFATLPGALSDVLGIYTLIQANGDVYVFAAKEDGLYWGTDLLNPAGSDWSTEVGSFTFLEPMVDFATINDFMVVTNQNIAPYKVTIGGGSPTTAVLGGSPPSGARYCLTFKGWLLLASSTAALDGIYWSTAGLPEDWPAQNFEPIGENEGSVITGLAEFGGNVFIFKNRSVWMETTGSFESPRFEPIPRRVGTVQSRSIITTPYGIVFVGGDQVYLLREGGELSAIGRNVARWAEGVGAAAYTVPTHLDNPGNHVSAGVLLPQNLLTIWVNDALGYRFDLARQTWHTVRHEIGAPSVTARGSALIYNLGSNHELLGCENSEIWTLGAPDVRLGTNESLVLRTPHIRVEDMPGGGPNTEGQLFDVWVKVQNNTGSDRHLQLEVRRDKLQGGVPIEEVYAATSPAVGMAGASKWIRFERVHGKFHEVSFTLSVEMPSVIATANRDIAVTDFRVRWKAVPMSSEVR